MILPNGVTFDSGAVVVVSIFLISLGGVISVIFKLLLKAKDDHIVSLNSQTTILEKLLDTQRDINGETTGKLVSTLAGIAQDNKVASLQVRDAISKMSESLDRQSENINQMSRNLSDEHRRMITAIEHLNDRIKS